MEISPQPGRTTNRDSKDYRNEGNRDTDNARRTEVADNLVMSKNQRPKPDRRGQAGEKAGEPNLFDPADGRVVGACPARPNLPNRHHQMDPIGKPDQADQHRENDVDQRVEVDIEESSESNRPKDPECRCSSDNHNGGNPPEQDHAQQENNPVSDQLVLQAIRI